jgi:hypothetical protein
MTAAHINYAKIASVIELSYFCKRSCEWRLHAEGGTQLERTPYFPDMSQVQLHADAALNAARRCRSRHPKDRWCRNGWRRPGLLSSYFGMWILELLRRILATANRSLVWRQSSALAGVRHDRCGFSRPKRKVSDRRKGGGREGPDYMIFPNPLADTFNARRRKLCGNQCAA